MQALKVAAGKKLDHPDRPLRLREQPIYYGKHTLGCLSGKVASTKVVSPNQEHENSSWVRAHAIHPLVVGPEQLSILDSPQNVLGLIPADCQHEGLCAMPLGELGQGLWNTFCSFCWLPEAGSEIAFENRISQ
mmetsp:Transcript_52476/g.119663  ORF Transcript_52476/g.119663 Transcript_52476/m.119663 type:complete len:133 (+) Transcript_52476:419-817(+)